MTNTYTRATSNPNGEVNQPNVYGESDYVPQPQGRSYDNQVVGLNPDGTPRTNSALRTSGTIASGHDVVTEVRDARYNSSKPLSEATLDDVVFLKGGVSMELRSAIAAGYLPANVLQQGQPQAPQAQPRPTEAAPEADQPETKAQPTGSEEALAGDHAEAEVTISAFAQATDVATQESLIDAAASGSLTDAVLETAAQAVGSMDKVQAARTALESQALGAIGAATGLEGGALNEFVASLYADHPEAMASAIRSHLGNRSTSAYRDLAAAVFVGGLEVDGVPEAGPGVSVREDRGQIVVGVAGREYRLQDALRLGLVRASKRSS